MISCSGFHIICELFRGLTTVGLEQKSRLDAIYLMLTTKLACMLGSISVVQMGRLCLARYHSSSLLCVVNEHEKQSSNLSTDLIDSCSGSFKLVLVLELKLEITSGARGTFLRYANVLIVSPTSTSYIYIFNLIHILTENYRTSRSCTHS